MPPRGGASFSNVNEGVSVIFGSQVSYWLRYCMRDELHFTALLWQNSGRNMALYREQRDNSNM